MKENIRNILYLLKGEQQYYEDLLRRQNTVPVSFTNVSPNVQRLISVLSNASQDATSYNNARVRMYISATLNTVLFGLNSWMIRSQDIFTDSYLQHFEERRAANPNKNLPTDTDLFASFRQFFTSGISHFSCYFVGLSKSNTLMWHTNPAEEDEYYEMLNKMYDKDIVNISYILDITTSLIFLSPTIASGPQIPGTSHPYTNNPYLETHSASEIGWAVTFHNWSEAIDSNNVLRALYQALCPFIKSEILEKVIKLANPNYQDIKLATVYALNSNTKSTTEVSSKLEKTIHDIVASRYIYTVIADNSFDNVNMDIDFQKIGSEFDNGVEIEGVVYRRVTNNPSCFFEIVRPDGTTQPVAIEFEETKQLLYNAQLSTMCCDEIELSEINRVQFAGATRPDSIFNPNFTAVVVESEVPDENGMKLVKSKVYSTIALAALTDKVYLDYQEGIINSTFVTNGRSYETFLLDFKSSEEDEEFKNIILPPLCATFHIKLAVCPHCGKIYAMNNTAIILGVSMAFSLHASGVFPFDSGDSNKKLTHSLNREYFKSRFGTAFKLLKDQTLNHLNDFSLDYSEAPIPEFDGISLKHALNDIYKEKKILVRNSRASSLPKDTVDLYSHLMSVSKVIFKGDTEESLSPEVIIPDFFRRIQIRSDQEQFGNYLISSEGSEHKKYMELPIANIPLLRINSIIGGTNLLLTIRDYYYTVLYNVYTKSNMCLEASCLNECYNIETFARILSGYLNILYRYDEDREYIPICDYCILFKPEIEVIKDLRDILESPSNSLDVREDSLPEGFPEKFKFNVDQSDKKSILDEAVRVLDSNSKFTRREMVLLTYAYLEYLSYIVVDAQENFVEIPNAQDFLFSREVNEDSELSILSRVGTASESMGSDSKTTFEKFVRTLFYKIEARFDKEPLSYYKNNDANFIFDKDPGNEVLIYDASLEPVAPKINSADIHLPYTDFIYLMGLIFKVSFQSPMNSLKKLWPFHASIKYSPGWPSASLFRYRVDAKIDSKEIREKIAYNYLDLLCSTYFTYDCSRSNYLDYVDSYDGRFVESSAREFVALIIKDKTKLDNSEAVTKLLSKESLNKSTGYFDIIEDEYRAGIYSQKENTSRNLSEVENAYKKFEKNRLNSLKLILKQYKCISAEKMLFPDTKLKSNLLMLLPDPFSDLDDDILMRLFLLNRDKLDEVCQRLEMSVKNKNADDDYDGLRERLASCLSIVPESVFEHFKDFFNELAITSPYIEKLLRK